MKKIIISAVAAAAALSICLSSCTIVYESSESKDGSDTTGSAVSTVESEKPKTPLTPPEDDALAQVVTTCCGYDITCEDFYFFMYYLSELIYKNNEMYITMYYGGEKPDYNYSLKDQYIMSDTTWYDYIVPQTKTFIAEACTLAKAAKDEGVEFSAAEAQRLKQDIDAYAMPSGIDFISKDCIAKCLEIICINDLYYYSHLEEKSSVTIEEINAEFEKNKKNYTMVDIKYYQIPYSDDPAATGAQGTTVFTKDQAKAYADRLVAAGVSDEFEKIVEEIYKATDPDCTEEELKEVVNYCCIEGQTYYEYDFLDWAFDNARKAGDVTCIEADDADTFIVTACVKPAYKDETATASVRHVLVADEATADEVLAKFEASDKSEQAFAELAAAYTTDPGSRYTGGLYKNFAVGTMVQTFNDWSFDEARKTGDTGKVKTDYGYHVMYYVSQGKPMYEATVETTLVSAKKQATYEALVKDVTATFIDGFIENLNA